MRTEEAVGRVRAEIGKAVLGQESAIEHVLVAFLADGHVLLESVPGLAKTLLVRSVARCFDLPFSRIQFTPDLMPSDVTGTTVFDPKSLEFSLRKGPIFTGVLLADEVNRTPPKTQSALLEAMEERQATIGGVTHPLPFPFLVFATQNPLESEGTYPLPEAQQDRFMMKVVLEYPPAAVETDVYRRYHSGFRSHELASAGLTAVLTADDLKSLREEVSAVSVENKIFDYVHGIVSSTRSSRDIYAGASPRAGLALIACSKAVAAMRGRGFVIPDDVKELALPVLRHRVMLRPEAEIEGLTADEVLRPLLSAQTVPR